MTTRNLDALFAPRSIALIGASNHAHSVGAVIARNLAAGGFAGPILPVNPHERAIGSVLCHASVADLPITVDLAVIATPAPTVPGIIAELGARGTRAAVVISAGFSAQDGSRQALLDAAKPHCLRIVGPNCLGFLSPGLGINASFAQGAPKAGGIALIAQSGAVAAAAIDWAHGRGVGFSHVISIGDAADVDVGDLLDYLALDAATKGIVVYIESITDARKFMSAGRIASRAKPVVVIKAGRSQAGAHAAFSHTGALAGADSVYDAAIRRAGMLRADDLREVFDAITTLAAGVRLKGDRLAILTNGGGAGVMAADTLELEGGQLAALAPATQADLAKILPAKASNANPTDILGDAPPERYGESLAILLADPGVDAALVLNCPTGVADSTQAAQYVVDVAAQAQKPVFAAWLGDSAVAAGRALLSASGISVHDTPSEASRSFLRLATYRQNQDLLLRTPVDLATVVDTAAARSIIDAALAAGRTTLSDSEARRLLAHYGVPTVTSELAGDPGEAAEIAGRIGGPVALKIASPDISHKTDVGGVVLNLTGAAAVRQAAETMLRNMAEKVPAAYIAGFVVEAMCIRPQAEELIAGISRDPLFGPTILFGRGGVAVEVDRDTAIGLAPLDNVLAEDLIGRTAVARRLAGYRGRPPADHDAIDAVLIALSQMACDLPNIAELDINPLLADSAGVMALDARVRLTAAPGTLPAILPYPSGLVSEFVLADRKFTLRPLRAHDAGRLEELIDLSDPADVRLRFGGAMRHLPDLWARRLAHIDYDREMAFAAELADGTFGGVVRLSGDPQGWSAEFAIMVRSDLQGIGLGRELLGRLTAYAKVRGYHELWGDVARDNARMLDFTHELGFGRTQEADQERLKVVKILGAAAPT